MNTKMSVFVIVLKQLYICYYIIGKTVPLNSVVMENEHSYIVTAIYT